MTQSFSRFAFMLYAAAASLLIALALIIPKGDDVLFINGNHSSLLDSLFSSITTLGEGLLFLPLVVYLLFIRFRYAILTAVVCVGHSVLCAFLKRGLFSAINRPIAVIDNALLYFVPGVDVNAKYSFPSGHTATIFCLALLLTLIIKKKTPALILLCLALLVGYSRIYLLQHFLIDVAGGAVVGIAFTFLMWRLFHNDSMPGWMNHSIKLNPTFLKSRVQRS